MTASMESHSVRFGSLPKVGGLRCCARWAALAIAITVGVPSVLRADVIYVNHAAIGANNGESWTDAFTDLQAGLAAAVSGDEIWVAKGTYHPAGPGGSRYETFQLKTGVGLYGGFLGTETSRDQRDFTAHETILSGDLNEDDMAVTPSSNCCAAHEATGCDVPECAIEVCASIPQCCATEWSSLCARAATIVCNLCDPEVHRGDNSLNVVTGSGVSSTARIDGFTVSAGHANLSTAGDYNVEGSGAGIHISNGSPTIAGCVITDNRCVDVGCGAVILGNSAPHFENTKISLNQSFPPAGHGVGVFVRIGGNPTFVDCEFSGNVAAGFAIGGGVCCIDPDTQCTFVRSTFVDNSSVYGGGGLIEIGTTGKFVSCKFSNNSASLSGGGLFFKENATAHIEGCLFSGNQAASPDVGGGAIRVMSGVTLRVRGSTFYGNSALFGAAISSRYGDPFLAEISNSVFWNNTTPNGGSPSEQFASDVPLSEWSIDYSTIEGLDSSIVGVGNSGLDPMFVDPDGPDNVVGTPDDDLRLSPDSPCIDAGSNSLVGADVADLDGDGNTTEKTPLDFAENPRFLDDLNTLDTGEGSPPVVDMGAFEFIIDCNANHTPDDLDISTGTSLDEDGNGVPDECEGMGIVGSTPPPDSIDARQPLAGGGNSAGWYTVQLDWDGLWTGAGQLSISELGGDGVAPGIAFAGLVNGRVFVLLTAPIEPGAWTVITYPDSGASTRIGFLPGDVNGDGVSSGVDILALVDVINGVRALPIHSTDMNRDNVVDVTDVLRLIDMLNGAGGSEAWYMRSLPG